MGEVVVVEAVEEEEREEERGRRECKWVIASMRWCTPIGSAVSFTVA